MDLWRVLGMLSFLSPLKILDSYFWLTRFISLVFFYGFKSKNNYPANIYLLKVNNKNTRTSCEIY